MKKIPKKKMANNKFQKLINVSLAVFGVSIVVFAVIGAYIIDNFSNMQQLEDLSHMEDDTYKGQIDDKLRFIALQDENIQQTDVGELPNQLTENTINQETIQEPENITLEPEDIENFLMNRETNAPKTKFEEYNEKYRKKTGEENSLTSNNVKTDDPFNKIPQTKSPLNLKVVIGDFSTKTAAEQELTYISSQFSTPPFIRVINGAYVIQVAAFKTPETAYEYVNSLRQQGYTARVIEE